MGADQLGDDAAALDIADQRHRNIGRLGKAHIGDVAVAQVDFRRTSCSFDEDEVRRVRETGERAEDGRQQTRGQPPVFARARDIAAARNAWETAKALLSDTSYGLVLLDELNIVLRYDYLPLDEVLATLMAKPRDLHVVVTGRNARPELIEAADLVTEMTLVKHPFRAGVKAQPGIEF